MAKDQAAETLSLFTMGEESEEHFRSIYANFDPDDEPTQALGAFPLRKFAPDAASYLAKAGHFSTRDLKFIVDYAYLDADPKNPLEVYSRLLDILEDFPWFIWPLEIEVAKQRLATKTGRSVSGMPFAKMTRYLEKFPNEKLRIGSYQSRLDRVGEFFGEEPVSTEMWVAAFMEHALGQSRMAGEEDFAPFLYEVAPLLVGGGAAEETFDKIFKRVEANDTWPLLYMVMDRTADTALKTGCHQGNVLGMVAKTIAGMARSESVSPDLFRRIESLAGQAAELAGSIEVGAGDMDGDDQGADLAKALDTMARNLRSLGLTVESSTLSGDALAHLSDPRIQALAARVDVARAGRPEREARSKQVDEDLAQAMSRRAFGEARLLMDEAEILQREIERCDALQKQFEDIVDAAVTDGHAAIEALVVHLSEPAEGEALFDLAASEPRPSESGFDQAESVEADARVEETPVEEEAEGTVAQPGEEPEKTEAGRVESDLEGLESESGEGEPLAPEAIGDDDATTVQGDARDEGAEAVDEAHAATVVEPEVSSSDAEPGQGIEAVTTLDPEPDMEGQVATPFVTECPIDPACLSDLVAQDLVGLAAEAADTIEATGTQWPVSHAALRAAAASRIPHRSYDPEGQAFIDIATRAQSPRSDESALVTFGAFLRPAVRPARLEDAPMLRQTLPRLAKGPIGSHLLPLAEAVSELDYDFPPSPDKLAQISGRQMVPRKERIRRALLQWQEVTLRKTSRWPFTTAFMHNVASDAGHIGRAIREIVSDSSYASGRARAAIEELRNSDAIEDRAAEFAVDIGKPSAGVHPKGIEYLQRQFEEALSLLDEWIKADEREGSRTQRSDEKLRQVVGGLQTRLTAALEGVQAEAKASQGTLQGAVALWLAKCIEDAIQALAGEDTGSFSTLKDALTAEQDLIPTELRLNLADPEKRIQAFRDLLEGKRILDPREAFRAALDEGAFETATRLGNRYEAGENCDKTIRARAAGFAAHWHTEVGRRERRLKSLAKVDYAHQQEIDRRLEWCETALKHLSALGKGEEIADLSDIPASIGDLDQISELIEESIREDQVARIRQYRKEENAEEADSLLDEIMDLTLEAAEDRIAELRDGRSAATMETDLEGCISQFTPGFVRAAAAPDWPSSIGAYESAFATPGPLFTEEDRRAPALEFISLFKDVCRSAISGNPSAAKIRTFFEEIGFEDVRVSGVTSLGRPKAWSMTLGGRVVSDGWFLPPSFGSNASSFRLLVIGPQILPEAIQKALDPETPTIIFIAGVADLARRREFAERLRAAAIPAVLIDEALAAFAVTRRETRARTIFECGLPYGRVEPYTTDAGQIPKEMFFGREAEIRHIMSKTADGCLVYGGRQLGKSALLSHVAKTRHDPAEDRIIVRRDVKSLGNAEKTSAIWGHLNGMLSDFGVVRASSRTADDVCRDIRGWLNTRPEGRVICLFDETDNFMATETRAEYPELGRLKELMEDTGRAFKVVFAGLHNVKRMHQQPNSPLAHLGQPICVGPLNRTQDDKRAAYDLVVSPMRAAGFRFDDTEAVEEILAWANYYPSLVQEYAKGLLASLHGVGSGKAYNLPPEGPLWTIPREQLFEHRNFNQIQARVREKFHLTLDLDPRYALVAYTLAWLNAEGNELKARTLGFAPDELLEHASAFWPINSEQPTAAAFDVLLDELFELGVIGKVPVPGTSRFRYCLRSRQVITMLGTHDDIDNALLTLRDKDPAVSYDRVIHRKRYGTSVAQAGEPTYSPLSDLEIGRLLSEDDNTPRIVCGLGALGLGKVSSALKRMADDKQLPARHRDGKITVTLTNTVKAFTAEVGAARAGKVFRVVVHTPSNSEEAHKILQWLEKGRPTVLDGHVRPLLIFDAFDPRMRSEALRRPDQTEFLKPWASDMLRVHLHNIEDTLLDTPEERRRILMATGGLPVETVALVQKLRHAANRDEVLAGWDSASKLPKDLLEHPMAKVLAYMDGGNTGQESQVSDRDFDDLDDIVRDEFDQDLVTMAPDMQACGLVSLFYPAKRQIRRSALGGLVGRTGYQA